MFDPMPSIARTVLVELILREMSFDPRNAAYLAALRPALRIALRENNWAAQAAEGGIPIDVLKRAALALRYILWRCGAEPSSSDQHTPSPAAEFTTAASAPVALPPPRSKAGRPPKLTAAQRAQARQMRASGTVDTAIARALGVSSSTIARL